MLNVKSQKFLGSINPVNGLWSIPFEYTPEDEKVLQDKGILFIVIDFESIEVINLSLISKILIDEIKEHYYGNIEDTPLNALENAVNRGKEKIESILKKHGALTNSVNYDLSASVFWKDILYLAQVGKTTTYLIRKGKIYDIGNDTNGEVMTASGILEEDDSVIISTKQFKEDFKGENLVLNLGNLENLIQKSLLPQSVSTVLIAYNKNKSIFARDNFNINSKGNILQKLKPNISEKFKKPFYAFLGILILLLAAFLAYLFFNNINTAPVQEVKQDSEILNFTIKKDSINVRDIDSFVDEN